LGLDEISEDERQVLFQKPESSDATQQL
jgi:hypothetical protein